MPNSKKKGNAYELKIAHEFIEMGWGRCVSSRSESKRMDDKGVDLCYTEPFYIQAKAWESAPSYHKVLDEMPDGNNYNLLFHKRNRKGEVVVMKKEVFYEILQKLIKAKVICPK